MTDTLDLELLELEAERLRQCKSEEGFFKRLATVTLPSLIGIKPIGNLIREWEEQNSQFTVSAFQEVIDFLWWHWDLACKIGHRELRALVWSVVRIIRGPLRYINWGSSLSRQISPMLDEIIALDIGDNKRPSLSRFFEMRKHDDIREFHANQDCDPRYLWQSLQSVLFCWQYRHECAISLRWRKPQGTFIEIMINANNQVNHFLIMYVAEELRCLHKKKPSSYFQREKFQSIFDHFVTECKLIPAYQRVGLLKEKKKVSKSTKKIKDKAPPDGSDQQNFCDWYKEWKENSKNKGRTQKMAINDFRKQTRITLSKSYKDSTFLYWMTAYNNRMRAKGSHT